MMNATTTALAALAALRPLRLPAVTISGVGGEASVRTLTAEQARYNRDIAEV